LISTSRSFNAYFSFSTGFIIGFKAGLFASYS
jgi:hypothetical protein